MYCDMEQWADIRHRILVKNESKRSVLRDTGMHWSTLKKILEHSQPPGYQLETCRPKPVLGSFLSRIEDLLEQDKGMPKKQRLSAKRISTSSGMKAIRAATPRSKKPCVLSRRLKKKSLCR